MTHESTNSTFSSIIKDHVARRNSVHTHAGKLLVLSRLLEKLFGVKLEELIPGIETKLGSKLWGLRGRADLIFSNVIFEIKVDINRELDDAERQLSKYFQVLLEREPKRKHIGVVTDSIQFIVYTPKSKNGKVVGLNKAGSLNIADTLPSESVLWLDSFIFSKPKIIPSAMDLRWRYGPDSPTHSVVVDALRGLWDKVWNETDVSLKLDLWAKNMEIVYGSRPKVASFIDQTYLVTLVKLIVYLRLGGQRVVREEDLMSALTGEYFTSYGIDNLIEEDFFAWMLHPEIIDDVLRLAQGIIKELLRYDLSQIDEDFFKEIYQEIVRRSERHRIGEYYTPEWLVQLALKETISLWSEKNRNFPRILDPACGSGTFLCNAIHMGKEELQKQGKSEEQILKFILSSIIGLDINPLATLIARANYLLSLGNLLQLGQPIFIPIYTADSIQMPRLLTTLVTEGSVTTYEVQADGHALQIPKSVVDRRAVVGEILAAIKDAMKAYKFRRDRNEALEIFKKRVLTSLSKTESNILKSTLNTMLTLMDKGLDSIWVFMLNNIYAPVMFKETKFDVVIGNPPWIAMQYIENVDYQDFLKRQAIDYGLLQKKEVKLFANIESATLFFNRCADLYVKDNGMLAFVMPRSVLTGAFHHVKFKNFRKPSMKLAKIYDLEHVNPLFNVPSCVLFALKAKNTSYPVPATEYRGTLPEKNLALGEANRYLSSKEYQYSPPVLPTTYSHYYEKVRRGAFTYPGSLWFVDFEPHPVLGIDTSTPLVRTSEEAAKLSKSRWKGVRLQGKVESEFIYVTLQSKELVHFGYKKLKPFVLPIKPLRTNYDLMDVAGLRKNGCFNMANWVDDAQKIWERRRSSKDEKLFPRLIDRLNYRNLLTAQNPRIRYLLIYNAHGTNLASTVIKKKRLSSISVLRALIKPSGFIVNDSIYAYETNDELEAHYLCAVLNSGLINEKIKPLQPRGLFGERTIHRRPFMFPIPKFDNKDNVHLKLAELSKKCHDKIASLRFKKRSAAGMRKDARKAVRLKIAEIDQLVSQLLG